MKKYSSWHLRAKAPKTHIIIWSHKHFWIGFGYCFAIVKTLTHEWLLLGNKNYTFLSFKEVFDDFTRVNNLELNFSMQNQLIFLEEFDDLYLISFNQLHTAENNFLVFYANCRNIRNRTNHIVINRIQLLTQQLHLAHFSLILNDTMVTLHINEVSFAIFT